MNEQINETIILARTYIKNHKKGKGIRLLEQLIAEYPEQIACREELGLAYLSRGWHKKALKEFEAAVRLNFLDSVANKNDEEADLMLERMHMIVLKNDKIRSELGSILIDIASEALENELIRSAKALIEKASEWEGISEKIQGVMDQLNNIEKNINRQESINQQVGIAQPNKESETTKENENTSKLWKILKTEKTNTPNYITRRKGHKIGRNEMCPCRSGKKYKKCCGKQSILKSQKVS